MTNVKVQSGELVDVAWLNQVARGAWRKTTAKQVLNSVAETDLLNGEITIDAGCMGTTGAIVLAARGDWIQNSGAARDVPRLKLKLGGTTLLDTNVTGATVAGAIATRQPWRVDAVIANLGATNAQWCSISGRWIFGLGAALGAAVPTTGEGLIASQLDTITTGSRRVDFEAALAAAIDTTAANVLALTTTNPTATATCDVTLKHAIAYVI